MWFPYVDVLRVTSLSTENKRSSIWQLCRHRWHRKLSLWQLTMPPVMAKLSNWRTLVFSIHKWWTLRCIDIYINSWWNLIPVQKSSTSRIDINQFGEPSNTTCNFTQKVIPCTLIPWYGDAVWCQTNWSSLAKILLNKMHFRMTPVKRLSFCPGINVLTATPDDQSYCPLWEGNPTTPVAISLYHNWFSIASK